MTSGRRVELMLEKLGSDLERRLLEWRQEGGSDDDFYQTLTAFVGGSIADDLARTGKPTKSACRKATEQMKAVQEILFEAFGKVFEEWASKRMNEARN